MKLKVKHEASEKGLTFQDLIFRLQQFWAKRGCVLQQPYDVEVGAGTMHPETFLRVLGPTPYRVAYVQPSRRPADGRYGENPNRLYKHTQMQVILKPSPSNIQDMYLESLAAIGIGLAEHDLRFEEDNWESPTLGAWGIGWQILFDGQEITQFTYFQQCGGQDLDPISVELTYGLERIAAVLQDVESAYELRWSQDTTYGQVRLAEEQQFSVYSFDLADAATTRKLFQLYEKEAQRVLSGYQESSPESKLRYPILPTYELCLKCSHLFNQLDARGVISTTERATLIGRVRALACRTAADYLDQQALVQPQGRPENPVPSAARRGVRS
ncbi:MAG TPA: glycine--tRNA ligase subunit alpha [Candidatus Dormibacteraeota bacterium]|nr:glycine--tRNA ligase subunit alpha [Candidatus Dormibacteraeota bacterium]